MNFIPSSSKAFGNAASFRNRRAAMRQTEEQRSRIFAKHQALVGTLYKNMLSARRAANRELDELPEYWDEDTHPRLPLNISSSCFAQIIPSSGGVFLYFRSNPDKGYFYPSAGTKAETAKRVYDLVSSGSLGTAYHNYWGAQNGAVKKTSKSGKSYSYKLKGGKTLDLKKFDRLGSKLAGV
jgi:hypothetical protein